MNHAIIAWLQTGGHEVTVLLPQARLPSIWERYDIAPVAGNGFGVWRGYVFPKNPLTALVVLAREAFAALPAGPAAAALQSFWRKLRFGQADAVLGAYPSAAQRTWCLERLLRIAPDAVLIDTIFRAQLLADRRLAGIRSVIIAHDVFFLRQRALRGAGYRVYPAELDRETEARLLGLADVIAAIQPKEAALIREMCPAKTVCTVPMPAVPCRRPDDIERIPGRLVFVGSATLPNLDGLRWLFAEVWPRLKTQYPEVTLDLAGDCGSALQLLPAGVTRLGRVQDLAPILHRSALAIAPLRVGSGLSVKLLDYARHGLMTVATLECVQGLAQDPNAPFVAVGDANAFAQAVAAALDARQAAVENQALEYVARHYSIAASFAELQTALNMPVR